MSWRVPYIRKDDLILQKSNSPRAAQKVVLQAIRAISSFQFCPELMSPFLETIRSQEKIVFAYGYRIDTLPTPEITRFDYAYRYDIVDINENDY